MAPAAPKRRRVEDDVRPKKKFRPVKKQKNYHSSSEDEGSQAPAATGRASDAPRTQPKHTLKAQVSIAQSKTHTKSGPHKSILKRSQQVLDAGEESPALEDESVELDKNTALNALQDEPLSEDDEEPILNDSYSASSDSENASLSESEPSITSSQAQRNKKKRNDPDAFATSISKILDTKLTTSKRSDPVLSRSKSAAEANKTLADAKLEQKARAQIRLEKRQTSEKGRVKDVLGLETPAVETGKVMEEEKRLKKTAQRGVVRLFNAVRAAQVKAEDAMQRAREEGVVGMAKREERVNEMSKQGFLDLISSGGNGHKELRT